MEVGKKKGPRAQPTPFHVFFSNAMDMANISNVDLAERLNYAKPNVIAMMRNGSMKVPLNKIPAIAKALRIDQIALLQYALTAYMPELWETLKEVLNDRLMTRNEAAVLELLRQATDGRDVDLVSNDQFVILLQTAARKALDASVLEESRGTPGGRPARDSRIAKLNAEMRELLTRQAEERQKLNEKMMNSLEGKLTA